MCTSAQPIPHPGRKDPILGMSSMKDPAIEINSSKKEGKQSCMIRRHNTGFGIQAKFKPLWLFFGTFNVSMRNVH